tara:strand:- start:2155 stop:2355 length:201 start_codon:yes stop_codon:yes gene_type:complete|eukprot:scaffold59947_cov59-Phaeocystis_antarctica.AAC.3
MSRVNEVMVESGTDVFNSSLLRKLALRTTIEIRSSAQHGRWGVPEFSDLLARRFRVARRSRVVRSV